MCFFTATLETLERVSQYETTPPILPTPPFLWKETSEPPFFKKKIQKLTSQQVMVPVMFSLFQVKKVSFTD